MNDNEAGFIVNPDIDPTATRAFINVDYEEFKPWTFKGVDVSIGEVTTRFPNLDEAYAFAHENAEIVLSSSSVDNYRQDIKTQSLN